MFEAYRNVNDFVFSVLYAEFYLLLFQQAYTSSADILVFTICHLYPLSGDLKLLNLT